MRIKQILSILVAFVIFTIVSSLYTLAFAATDIIKLNLGQHDIVGAITTLQDPDTMGFALNVKPTPDDKDLNLAVKLDILVSLKRNLGEKANGSIAYGPSWKILGEEIPAPEGIPAQRRHYRGNFNLEGGLESSPEKTADDTAGDWRFNNGNVGISIEQHIPYSRVKFPWCSQAAWPLILGGSYKFVADATGKSDSGRGLVFADWELPVISTINVSAFLGGRGELYYINDGKQFNYVEGRAQLSSPALKKIIAIAKIDVGDPLIFAKYIRGSQPPEFAKREEWRFGIGTKWTW